MKVLNLGSLDAIGSTTPIDLGGEPSAPDAGGGTPFVMGRPVVWHLTVADNATGETFFLESSPDGVVWTAIGGATFTVANNEEQTWMMNVTPNDRYIRMTTDGTLDGTGYLLGGA